MRRGAVSRDADEEGPENSHGRCERDSDESEALHALRVENGTHHQGENSCQHVLATNSTRNGTNYSPPPRLAKEELQKDKLVRDSVFNAEHKSWTYIRAMATM